MVSLTNLIGKRVRQPGKFADALRHREHLDVAPFEYATSSGPLVDVESHVVLDAHDLSFF